VLDNPSNSSYFVVSLPSPPLLTCLNQLSTHQSSTQKPIKIKTQTVSSINNYPNQHTHYHALIHTIKLSNYQNIVL